VAGRAFAFADSEIIHLARHEFIPVTADDWYQRRRDDAEGEFFRKVANQGPRKGEGGSTRQGIYCLTADGELLAYKNAGQNAHVMREVLQQALSRWRALSAERRQPGAVQVGDPAAVDRRYVRELPPGGLALRVFTRALDRDGKGDYCDAACKVGSGDEAGRDHLWLTRDEWKSLVPAQKKPGTTINVPKPIAERIARFHLIDNTRGEPPMWSQEDIRQLTMTLRLIDATDDRLKLRFAGEVLLATAADPSSAKRGFDARLAGILEYDPAKGEFVRFDGVAVGDHWGEGTYTRGARPGRTALGVAFELADLKSPADLVPPQAARDPWAYFGPGYRLQVGSR
jgi:hypothetical protein